jgi:hypothetical protein
LQYTIFKRFIRNCLLIIKFLESFGIWPISSVKMRVILWIEPEAQEGYHLPTIVTWNIICCYAHPFYWVCAQTVFKWWLYTGNWWLYTYYVGQGNDPHPAHPKDMLGWGNILYHIAYGYCEGYHIAYSKSCHKLKTVHNI